MAYREFKPCPELQRFVKCFWRLEHDYSQPPMDRGERIWPDAHVEVLFTYGARYERIERDGAVRLPQHYMIGQLERELLLNSAGVTGLVGIRLYPWGLYPLVRRSVQEFTNTTIALEQVFPDTLLARLRAIDPQRPEDAICTLESILAQELSAAPDSAIERIASDFYFQKRFPIINRILAEYELHPKQFQRQFKRRIGISAQKLLKILRFHDAKRMIERDSDINMADVAYATGYADQAHFNRHFKSLYGITPAQHRERTKAMRACFAGRNADVVFVQDKH